MRRHAFLLSLLMACACAQEGDQPTSSGASTVSAGANAAPGAQNGAGQPAAAPSSKLPIGSACTPTDGYVPQFPPCASPAGGTSPGTCPPPNPQQNPGYSQLPPGIGYCLTNQAFPHGYFTMNCAAAADCPDGSLCDGVCWKPCTSDDECSKPTTCLAPPRNPTSRFIRYCTCVDCVPNDDL
jgi:hypothetical protein